MSDKINFEDTTFVIPARLDTITRLENIYLVTHFLTSHFNTNIRILEADNYNNHFLEELLPSNISLRFVEDYDPIFHRTKYINRLVQTCDTPYVAVWDTDVLVPPEQIIQSIEHLRANNVDFVYPYKRDFLDTSLILRELYVKTQDIELLQKYRGKMKRLYLPDPVGGAFFANRTTYIQSGLENESFYGWGREDGERLNRWKILEYSYKRVSGPLFHLTHERGQNSTFHSSKQDDIKHSEILRINSMSKEELKDEIRTW
ncbi:MAG TPA: galactosyltransferase-related protein [Balneolaceae bacterium]|nr:galactosyltransferase-related protein [Balneolaceae bacterium]